MIKGRWEFLSGKNLLMKINLSAKTLINHCFLIVFRRYQLVFKMILTTFPKINLRKKLPERTVKNYCTEDKIKGAFITCKT